MAEQTGRSLRLSQQGIQKADIALQKFAGKRDVAAHLGISPTTVTNFFTGRPVLRKKFHAICKKLKLDWQEVAELPQIAESEPAEKLPNNSLTPVQPVSRLGWIPFSSPSGSGDLNPSFRWEPGNSSDSRYELTTTGVLKITAGAYTDRSKYDDSAPIVIYPFDGDFEVKIKTRFSSTIHFQRAGIGIRSANNKYTYLRIQMLEKQRVEVYLNQPGQDNPPLMTLRYKEETVYFKMTRQGRYFSTFYSPNGEGWRSLIKDDIPEISFKVEIFVDVLSAHNSSRAIAEFSDFQITRL